MGRTSRRWRTAWCTSTSSSAASSGARPRKRVARRLDNEWLGWLRRNGARGCSAKELQQILLKEGFGEAVVRRAFDEVLRQPRDPAPAPARPSINVPGAKRFESSSIELY